MNLNFSMDLGLSSTSQFETVFVNKRGEIIETRECEAYYYDEGVQGFLSPKLESQSPKTTIKMIHVPKGQFWMGSYQDKKDVHDTSLKDECPQRKVTVSSFCMSATPITEWQWRCVANLPQEKRELDPLPPSHVRDGDNHPVVNVSWQDAIEFCARLSRYTGKNYRLPSEAEWEYACRAIMCEEISQAEWNKKHNKPFHFGQTIMSELANYDSSDTYQEEPPRKFRRQTTTVGRFNPNAFGLYDMHGNVWEWCLDPSRRGYGGASDDGRVWDVGKEQLYMNVLKNLEVLLQDERHHIVRGGSWATRPWFCRSAYRSGAGHGNYMIGFRIASESPIPAAIDPQIVSVEK